MYHIRIYIYRDKTANIFLYIHVTLLVANNSSRLHESPPEVAAVIQKNTIQGPKPSSAMRP